MKNSTMSGVVSAAASAVDDDGPSTTPPTAADAALPAVAPAVAPAGQTPTLSAGPATAESPASSVAASRAESAGSAVVASAPATSPPAVSVDPDFEKIITVKLPGFGDGDFRFPVAKPDPAPAGITGNRIKEYENLSVVQKTVSSVVKLARQGGLETKWSKDANGHKTYDQKLTDLARLVSPYLPKGDGENVQRKMRSWGAFDDLKSRAKASMGDIIIADYPGPSTERDTALKAIGLRKGHQLFRHLPKDDPDYTVPQPRKQAAGGKDKEAAGKKRKVKGGKKEDDDDKEDEELMNVAPTGKRVSRKIPVAKAGGKPAAKKPAPRRAAGKTPTVKTPAVETPAVENPGANPFNDDSDGDTDDAVSADEANAAQSAEENSPLPEAMSALQVDGDSPNDVDMVDADITAIYSPQDNIMSETPATPGSAAGNDAASHDAASPESAALESAAPPAAAPPAAAHVAAFPASTINIHAFGAAAAKHFSDPVNVPLEDALDLLMKHIRPGGNLSELSFDITRRLIGYTTTADMMQLQVTWRQQQGNA